MAITDERSAAHSRGIRKTVIFVLLFIAFVVAAFVYRVQQPRLMSVEEMKINGAYMLDTPRNIGDIQLIDQNGDAFTKARLEGVWTLVFFGFTHCPDVCPTTMAFLNEFVQALEGTEAEDTRVVMVSVDPARDTVEVLSEYVPYFNPDFTGVTGEFLDVHRFATALNTPFRKSPGQGEDYQVDHSANVVLINPRGDYHGFFRSPLDLAKMKVTYRSARLWWDR
jgi:protein SCO1/2